MKLELRSNFISSEEIKEILAYDRPIGGQTIENEHIAAMNKATYGGSILCDLTRTEMTNRIGGFQGDGTVVHSVPAIYHEIKDRIANELNISSSDVFFQYIVLGSGGKVSPHYDTGIPGYITYKCNICVDGPEKDVLHVGKQTVEVSPGDLYCFEANLYKHWIGARNVARIHLSYGFIVPNIEIGWAEDHPRIRMANRIWKKFIGS